MLTAAGLPAPEQPYAGRGHGRRLRAPHAGPIGDGVAPCSTCVRARGPAAARSPTGCSPPGRAPAGFDAYEALRVEARRPRFGVDTDHRTIPNELQWLRTAVHLDKGCYRGQETVARVHNLGRPPRRLVLLHLDGVSEVLRRARHAGAGRAPARSAGSAPSSGTTSSA